VLCVNDKGQAINYTISVKGPTAFVFTQASFNSLEDVITYAQGTPLKSVAVPGSRLILNHPARCAFLALDSAVLGLASSGVVARCAFFNRDLHSRSAIEFRAFAPLEVLPGV
jgi:hypothetical protein